MARFFIDRPIFAWVLAIVVMLAGALAITTLPLEQYPDIAPTRISVNASYTGASAQTVEDSVTQVIEQRMTGLDGLLSMSSTSSANGSASVSLSFVAGTDPNVAQMQVQNKLQQAMTQLPQAVQNQGVTVTKTGTDYLLIANLTSEDPSVTAADIGDYVASTLVDQISRIDGVGEVNTLGASYAMRIWLDPAQLQKYALMPSDISAALSSQNTQVSAGQLGALPAAADQALTATVTARSKLRTVEQFRKVVVKSATDGAIVRLADVARVELGSENYSFQSRYNGRPSAGMGVRLASGANALDVSNAVKARLDQLAPFFPNRMKAEIGYDSTPFVKVSVEEVLITLAEAMALVVLIMGLFMQNLRATLIPAIAVPVVLLGTFGVLALAGFSVNTLTLFGVVLAIGLLVDDAIVVVENVERLIGEGLSPREATRRSMGEITGALVGIALVLSAVFIPMAFFRGSTGVIYRQFSITIVSAMALSVLVALTLTPALCASLLRPGGHGGSRGPLGRFFATFNRRFDQGSRAYQALVGRTLHKGGRMLVIYALLAAAAPDRTGQPPGAVQGPGRSLMNRIKVALIATLALLGLSWLLADTLWPQPFGYFPFRTVFMQFSGVIAIGAMSVAMLLALRPKWLEPHLDGLDKFYRLHKWLGITALLASVLHWWMGQGTKWMVQWGWLVRPPRGPRPDPSQLGAIEGWLRGQRGLAESVGEWAFYAAAVLMVLALVKRFPYHLFRQTHKGLALAYLVLVYHSVVLVKFSYWRQPVGGLVAALLLGGSVAALRVLAGRVGAGRKVAGVIDALVYHPTLRVLESRVALQPGWPGHAAGQFAFAMSDPREGAHPYTIASAWNPAERRITFITKALGDHTGRLHERLKVGMPVTVEGPYGCFDFEDGSRRQVWIGAGIGITPLVARMKQLAAQPQAVDIDLFHPTAVYEASAIDKLQADARAAGVRLHLLVDGQDGRLDGARLRAAVPDWREASIWFCGPPGFGQALRKDLVAHGLPPRRFHQELFQMR